MDQAKNQEMLAAAKEELEVAKNNVRFLQQVVDGLTGLLGLAPAAASPTGGAPAPAADSAVGGLSRAEAKLLPRPKDAFLTVMGSRVGTAFKPGEVLALVIEEGLRDPNVTEKGYMTALNRLARDPESPIRQPRPGYYTYVITEPDDDDDDLAPEAGQPATALEGVFTS